MNFKCNYRKCRTELTLSAIVTSCSHIFCIEHNPSKLNNDNTLRNSKRKEVICPVCKTSLGGSFDFVEVDLQPPDSFKGMVLTGLKPDIIIEISARALGFWMYQMEQELQYNHYVIKKQAERFSVMENEFMKAYTSINEEKSILVIEKENLNKECEELREKLIAESRLVERLRSEIQRLSQNVSENFSNNKTNNNNMNNNSNNNNSYFGSRCTSSNKNTNSSMALNAKMINNFMTKHNSMFISPDSTLNSPRKSSKMHKTERANQLWGVNSSQTLTQPKERHFNNYQKSTQKYLSPIDNILNKQTFMPYEISRKQNPSSIESVISNSNVFRL